MKKVLFLAHNEEGGFLSKLSLESLTAARKLADMIKGDLIVGLWGNDFSKVSSQIYSSNPTSVYIVKGDDFKISRYPTDFKAMEEICKIANPDYIISPTGHRISRVAGGLAFKLNSAIDTFVTDFFIDNHEKLNIKRWYYRQRIEAVLSRETSPWFMTISSGQFEPFKSIEGELNIKYLDVTIEESYKEIKTEGFSIPHTGVQTLKPESKLLFVAGAGWTKKQSNGSIKTKDASNIILKFLEKSDASLGGSKSVVDMSGEGEDFLNFMTHLNQIGQTGSTPSHSKGIATCCHGEEPHVVGWRFIKERRAINLDPNCGWAHGKADILYVADAFEVMTKINDLLSK